MRSCRVSLCVPILLIACFTGSSAAQGGTRLYNPATETTMKGTVEKVITTTGRHGMQGIHLMMQSDNPVREVHVGPAAYVAKNGFEFSAGDQIEVTGSRVNLDGTDVILAREIKKDGKTLTLRNSQGIPDWSGGGRRSY